MKMSHSHKIISTALLALGLSSQAYAFPMFTVDPHAAFGATGGTHPGAFQADFLSGNASTYTDTSVAPIIHSEGWVNFSSFGDQGNNVLATTSGLNDNWQMWAEFTIDQILVSGAYSQPGSNYNAIGLHMDFWVDPSMATATTFIIATNSGGLATVTHGADSVKIATADLLQGVEMADTLGGAVLNTTNTFNLLNPAGTSLFTAPVPFYNVQFEEFNNTEKGVFKDPLGKFVTISQSTLGTDFNVVSEPTSLALMCMGFLGLGLSRRRKAS